MNNKTNIIRSSIGAPSVILIITAIGMVVFALLALRSSLNERNLANKTAASVKEYYELNSKAESLLASVVNDVLDNGSIKDEEIITSEVSYGAIEKGSQKVKFTVVSDNIETMSLKCEVIFDLNKKSYNVTKWSLCYEENGGDYGLVIPD